MSTNKQNVIGILVLVLAIGAGGLAQKPTKISRPCPSTTTKAAVEITTAGDISLTPCPNRLVSGAETTDPTTNYSYFNDFGMSPVLIGGSSNPDATLNLLRNPGGGTGADWQASAAASVIDGSAFGVIESVMGTGTAARVDIVSRNNDIGAMFLGTYAYTHATRVQFATLPASGDNYTFFFGFFGSGITDPNFQRGVLFRYGQGINGDKIQVICRDDKATWANTAVDTTANTITSTNTLAANDIVKISGNSTLPAPLAVDTDYYVINPTASTFQLSLTQGGTAIDLTTQGAATVQYASKETTVDTGITPVIDTWYRFRIEVNASGNSARFYVNGVLKATITTNISTGLTKLFTAELNNDKTAGTTSITATRVDYFYFKRYSTTSRL